MKQINKDDIWIRVVDDDVGLRRWVVSELRREGFSPVEEIEAETAAVAAWHILIDPPDVVVLDAALKDSWGWDVARLVREKLGEKAPKFVAHSDSWRYVKTRIQFRAAGVTVGVRKCEFDDLVRAILTVCAD